MNRRDVFLPKNDELTESVQNIHKVMEEEKELSAYGQFMWFRKTLQFLKEDLVDGVTKLDLTTNHVNIDGAKLLANHIKKEGCALKTLILDQCRMTIDASTLIIQSITKSHILAFSMNRNVMTNDVCQELANVLEQNPDLESLSINGCDIPADGCVAIANSVPKSKLRFLSIDSNCIFDKGAEAIAANLTKSNLEFLSVSDNQIWMGGTTAILKAIMNGSKITALNLSYNIIDLDLLGRCLRQTTLTQLSISGCKVNDLQFALFLEELGRTQLTTFAIEGFNYNIVPVSWPHVQDTLWTHRACFEILMRALRASHTLVDLRFGFLDLEQINSFDTLYQQNQISRPITISISDFGRSGNTWVLNFPNLSLLAPSKTLKWRSKVTPNGASYLETVFKNSTCNGEQLESLDVSSCSISDDILQRFLPSFYGHNLEMLNLSKNDISDMSIETLTSYFENSSTESLVLRDLKISENGMQRFFRFLSKDGVSKAPKYLEISFTTSDTSETGFHSLFTDLASLLKQNPQIKKLIIGGNVSVNDVNAIVEQLKTNSNLSELIIDSPIPPKYEGLNPQLDENIQALFNQLVLTLYQVLSEESSICKLHTFKFPLLTDVFMYNNEIFSLLGPIETKLEDNKPE